MRASVRGCYGWAVRTRLLEEDATTALPTVKAPRRTPRPTPDDVLLDALERAPLRERLMLVIAQRTGLRAGEVARVRREDVVPGIEGYLLHVRGKGARERLVPLDDELARILRLMPAGWVFPSSTRPGEHLIAHTVSRLMSEALGPGWTAHTLRHRYASLAYSVERDLRAVQEPLGHAQVTTTQVYTLVPDWARRRAAAGAGVERGHGGERWSALRPAA
ncbi:tyrosine-type recombinase/integrase [Pseudokineococcus sp. 1T1Z-3]|uniref:tyrosine-type recombinase/integrase n=1 Tax=Pseudokineococcus sp. 1T1Z-3 TaxID=3132745 RepID=UPI0030B12E93